MSTSEWRRQTASASASGSVARRRIATAAVATTAPNKRKPTTPSSLRNCSGVECGSTTASGLLRSRRSVSPNEPAPVPFAGWSTNAFHASCHQRQRLLELAEAMRPGVFVTCELLGLLNSCHRSRTKSAGPPARTTDAEAGDDHGGEEGGNRPDGTAG